MRKLGLFGVFLLMVFILASCDSTKVLKDNQYMLMKNTVTMTDVKGDEFSNMVDYVLPLPNNKFMGVFNAKTGLYANNQPKVDKKTGELKDTKFRKWLRESVGEPPVLLDSMMIANSEMKLKTAMKKMGYFFAEVSSEVVFPKPKKAQVNYYIKANEPYFVRQVNMNVPIYDFRKILVVNSRNALIKRNMRYDEDLISSEIERMTVLLRDQGYYNVNTSLFYCEVDTIDAQNHLDEKGHKTLTLTFVMDTSSVKDFDKYLYRYYFEDVTIHTNYNIVDPTSVTYDTVTFYTYRDKGDSTTYRFLTPKVPDRYRKNGKLKRDYKYRTITDRIYSKRGTMYSENLYSQSKKGLNDLNNFSTIDIVFKEDERLRDTVNKIGFLNSEYKLVRQRVHSISGQVDVRSDKTSLSFTYGNKNIFKGAENFSFNVYGSYFYYSLNNKYPEFGASVTIDFPRLFLFKHLQKPEALKYMTTLKLGGNYSGLYRRWMFNVGYSYSWAPNRFVNHMVMPIELKTINTDDSRSRLFMDYYTESYQRRFDKFFLLSFKYNFNYVVPFKQYKPKHKMRISIFYESTGMLLGGLNELFAHDQRWKLGSYKYTSLQGLEFTMNYSYTINTDNILAIRANAGVKLPVGANSIIPYEEGYFLGGSNSMRGFPFRGVGPGSHANPNKIEYTGDVKMEFNVEYRGTFYKAFKYGVFLDAGNVWLAQKYEDMEDAVFNINRFYKELALCAGVGIRLDFNFFIIRLDYAVPIYDPRCKDIGPWINKKWTEGVRQSDKVWNWAQGFKFAIGHAF